MKRAMNCISDINAAFVFSLRPAAQGRVLGLVSSPFPEGEL